MLTILEKILLFALVVDLLITIYCWCVNKKLREEINKLKDKQC